MDRCDFSSIMTCLKNHISESNQMNQPEFLYEVFEDFMDSPESIDFSFDNGLVCRWMTGQAKISPKICSYYGRASINLYAFNSNGNKGIACGLNNLQKIRDGEPLGGKSRAEDDFATADDEDDFLD